MGLLGWQVVLAPPLPPPSPHTPGWWLAYLGAAAGWFWQQLPGWGHVLLVAGSVLVVALGVTAAVLTLRRPAQPELVPALAGQEQPQ